jgi:hypothetical protein
MTITPHSTFTLHRPENVSPYAASMQIQPNKTHWIRRPCSFTICVRLVSRAATEPHRADSMSASSHRPRVWLQVCKPTSLISRSRRHLRPERLTYRECIRNVRFRPDWDGESVRRLRACNCAGPWSGAGVPPLDPTYRSLLIWLGSTIYPPEARLTNIVQHRRHARGSCSRPGADASVSTRSPASVVGHQPPCDEQSA